MWGEHKKQIAKAATELISSNKAVSQSFWARGVDRTAIVKFLKPNGAITGGIVLSLQRTIEEEDLLNSNEPRVQECAKRFKELTEEHSFKKRHERSLQTFEPSHKSRSEDSTVVVFRSLQPGLQSIYNQITEVIRNCGHLVSNEHQFRYRNLREYEGFWLRICIEGGDENEIVQNLIREENLSIQLGRRVGDYRAVRSIAFEPQIPNLEVSDGAIMHDSVTPNLISIGREAETNLVCISFYFPHSLNEQTLCSEVTDLIIEILEDPASAEAKQYFQFGPNAWPSLSKISDLY